MGIINHVLKNENEKITSLYGNRTYTLNGKKINDFHKGIDLIDAKVKSDYIIAFEDGVVTSVRDEIRGYDENKSAGNYVYIKHDNNYLTRYLHIAYGTVMVGVGDSVKKGDVIGFTGATGLVTGTHLHFEIKKNNESVNPLPYLEGNLRIKDVTNNYLGVPVNVDVSKNQIKINISNLRIRDNPDGNILGYVNIGTYNILNKETKNNYDWYNIFDNMWVAYDEEWANLNIIEDNKEDTDIDESSYELIYNCEKNDLYAINLYKGEKLYIKK